VRHYRLTPQQTQGGKSEYFSAPTGMTDVEKYLLFVLKINCSWTVKGIR